MQVRRNVCYHHQPELAVKGKFFLDFFIKLKRKKEKSVKKEITVQDKKGKEEKNVGYRNTFSQCFQHTLLEKKKNFTSPKT